MRRPIRLRTAGIGTAARGAVSRARLLFAAKTALAVGIAWSIAPHMPGSADQYPYYAPFGALISMYPTLMSSAKTGLQTLLGLGAGIGLATLVLMTVGPSLWSIAAVVGVGVIVSGTGWFGAGREYIPMAALFVLIIGGADAEDYSFGYVTQTAVGVVVGLLVNAIIPPAPLVSEAAARIDAFQQRLAAHLDDIAAALIETWPPERAGWMQDAGALAETSRSLRDAVAEADESRRGNPRAWRGRADTSREHARLEMLVEVAHQIRDVSGCLSDTINDRPSAFPLDPELVDPLAAACQAVADLLAGAAEDAGDLHARATEAVEALLRAVHTRSLETDAIAGPGVLSAMHLQRILLMLAPEADAESEGRQPDAGSQPSR
ncbi:FUSC family protein [Microbacterium sp. NPDC089987]|uniref:FUSC family protein n=1 Tax=Microbacterium sp. NPDC089987 TaxID=3364202 RepID=UPI00382FE84F